MTLTRFAYTPVGTFGRLYLPEFQCYTVERPWLDNRVKESCIPEGRYRLMRARFHRGGYDTYEVIDVPGRSLIKFHIGNTMHDVLGCIALGRQLGYVDGTWAVMSSARTFHDWYAVAEAQAGAAALFLTVDHLMLAMEPPAGIDR